MSTADKHYSERVVWLPELARDEDVLDGYTFIGCHLNGPAVLVLLDGVTFADNNLQGERNALLWEITENRPDIIGAIGLRNSTVEGCTLTRIGIAGSREVLSKF